MSPEPYSGSPESCSVVAGILLKIAGTVLKVAGTALKVTGAALKVTGTALKVTGTVLKVAGTRLNVIGSPLKITGSAHNIAGTVLGDARTVIEAARFKLSPLNLVLIGNHPRASPMNQLQDDIATMFETTLSFLGKNNNIWKNKPAFVDAVTRATAGTTQIRGRSGKQQSPTEGVTGDKAQVRDDLEDKLSVVADALAAFAAKTNNADIAAKVELNRSVIDRLSDSDLTLAAQRVLDATDQNLAALADYGITATERAALSGAADLFANKKESPREAIVGRRVETLALPEAINSVRSIFRNELDKLMTAFKKPEPDFYTGYFVSRVIVNHAATIPPKKPEPPTSPAGP